MFRHQMSEDQRVLFKRNCKQIKNFLVLLHSAVT